MGDVLKKFDYAIIGGGLSGLLVAYRMCNDPWYDGKSIVIFEDMQVKENDRTWCFWEEGIGEWDHLLAANWTQFIVADKEGFLSMPLGSYRYKMLRSAALYEMLQARIAQRGLVVFHERVKKVVESQDEVEIHTDRMVIRSSMVLTSVMGLNYPPHQSSARRLNQHFGGWFVRAEKPVFDPSTPVMMDFSVEQTDGICFMYVLPTSATEALVEFTVFGPTPWSMERYEKYIKSYMADLKVGFQVVEKEMGCIPMTTYDFEKNNSARVHHIGTAGGWTRPSTGYTFKNSNGCAHRLVENLKQSKAIAPAWSKRHLFYDAVMLDLIGDDPQIGVGFFMRMYRQQPIERIFRFLDGQSSWWDDWCIMLRSRPKSKLIRLAMKHLR